MVGSTSKYVFEKFDADRFSLNGSTLINDRESISATMEAMVVK
jgi:hypothetical protein